MSTLTGRIERYIKDLLEASGGNQIELKRSELAQTFMCVPSQINYVLETRFRNEQGYHVVSRRGAGGYFQIIRLEVTNDGELRDLIAKISQTPMDVRSAEGLLNTLYEEKFFSKRELTLLNAVVSDAALAPGGDTADMVRSSMLKNILITLLRVDC